MPDIVYGGDEVEDEEDVDKGLAVRLYSRSSTDLLQVLALHAPGQNNLAAAYYDADTRKLQVLEDTKDTWGWDLAVLCQLGPREITDRPVVEQFQPDQVVLSAAAPDALTKLVQDYCERLGMVPRLTSTGIQNPQTKLRALPHTNYTHTMATYHLAGVRLPHGGAVVAAGDSDLSWSDSGRGGGGAVPSDGSNTGEGDDGAGMGRLRLSLLKMGCRVNVDAPYAVSCCKCRPS
jgi:DNA mismatch repair protein MSH5